MRTNLYRCISVDIKNHMSVKDIAQLSYPKFVISRLWRDGNVSIPTSEKVIKEGDRLLVITSEKNVPALTVLFGEQANPALGTSKTLIGMPSTAS